MDTINRLATIFLLATVLFSASSCKSDKSVHAVVQVFQEQTTSTGQTIIEPVSQALVKFYSNRPLTEHIYVEVLTNLEGRAEFNFEHEVIIYCDVIAGSRSELQIPLRLLSGQTVQRQVILPE